MSGAPFTEQFKSDSVCQIAAWSRSDAVSVCAAGNESADNDETAIYPANDDCAYKISVAATNEKGELSNYSNYGSEKVDIAAPGSDILSTYAMDCYNPSIYSAEKQ